MPEQRLGFAPKQTVLTSWRAWRLLPRSPWRRGAGTARSSGRPAASAAPPSSCPADLEP